MLHRILGILVLAISIGAGWVWMDYREFKDTPLNLPAEGLTYRLQAGTPVTALARDLQQRRILARPLYFRLLARWYGLSSRLQAGEYRLLAGTTPLGLLEQFAAGKVVQHALTLVEGWTFRQARAAVAAAPDLEKVLDAAADAEIMRRLGHGDQHPEGRFFPDTYHFPKGTTDLEFLRRAYETMAGVLDREWRQRMEGLPLRTPYEALILASIVEKESGRASERPEIAGVFVRRLRRGMKLQTDPTVIYGLGEAFDGNLRRRDLKRDTPYNTYVHQGLPPTPIAMPGLGSIRAVLHPAPGKSLYFVAKGDGSHRFSATLEAHNRAVRRFQLQRK